MACNKNPICDTCEHRHSEYEKCWKTFDIRVCDTCNYAGHEISCSKISYVGKAIQILRLIKMIVAKKGDLSIVFRSGYTGANDGLDGVDIYMGGNYSFVDIKSGMWKQIATMMGYVTFHDVRNEIDRSVFEELFPGRFVSKMMPSVPKTLFIPRDFTTAVAEQVKSTMNFASTVDNKSTTKKERDYSGCLPIGQDEQDWLWARAKNGETPEVRMWGISKGYY